MTVKKLAAAVGGADSMVREQSVEAQAFNIGVAENALEAETRYRILIEQIPAVVFLAFLDHGVNETYISPQIETLLGYSPKEWPNDPARWYRRIHPEDRKRWSVEGAEMLLTGKPLRSVYRMLAHDDRVVWFQCEARMARRPDGRPWFIHGVAFDVTELRMEIAEHKLIERERAGLLAREQEARAAAETASRLKDEFLASVSHELRAPLTAILGWAEMLRSGTLDAAVADRALLSIERNAQAQARLVDDLLDASRIIAGKLRLNLLPVELVSVVESAVDMARPAVEAKQLRLKLALEPWVGPFTGDPDRLKQIVWNLLSNAIKFTPAGGSIEVRLERLGDKALITVSDTGHGISPEFLPYVFDRFIQSDGSINRIYGGLGLGLAIVKHLVESHGGTVNAFSPGKDKGAEFTVILPLAIPRNEPQMTNAPAAPTTPIDIQPPPRSGPLAGVRLLLVDDNADARDVLGAILRQGGAEVLVTASAAEAMGLLRQWRPDILISDIGMPEEDGYSLIRRVRSLPPGQGGLVSAIALTAYAGGQDRRRALEAGYQAHLAKPVESSALVSMVASFIA